MSEYIKREALINFANNHKGSLIDSNDIARFPAADVEEVIRCVHCLYSREPNREDSSERRYNEGVVLCECPELMGYKPNAMWEYDFCSYGERRDK